MDHSHAATAGKESEAAVAADLGKVEKLLQSWAAKICESTNDIISSALGRNSDFSSQGANGIFDDMRDRQSRIITVSPSVLTRDSSRLTYLSLCAHRRSKRHTADN
jgi:hypothetical protein